MSTKASRTSRQALGRGLASLIPEARPAGPAPAPGAQTLPIEKLRPNPNQPRSAFDEGSLEQLAQSIASRGILQPILVRRRGDEYEIVAGERRWRAAQIAGLHDVPALIKDLSDNALLEVALIENIQREDLNAIEEARAYEGLLAEHGYTQERLAQRVGKDRSTIANSLRLLKLPQKVQQMVVDAELSMGHARALLGLPEERILPVARQVVAEALSVRATERLVKVEVDGPAPDKSAAGTNPNVRALEERLMKAIGAPVKLLTRSGGKAGTIVIRYSSLDELDRLIGRFTHGEG